MKKEENKEIVKPIEKSNNIEKIISMDVDNKENINNKGKVVDSKEKVNNIKKEEDNVEIKQSIVERKECLDKNINNKKDNSVLNNKRNREEEHNKESEKNLLLKPKRKYNKKSKEEKDTAELNKTGEELWFLKNATEYGEKEIISKERRLKELEDNTNYYSNEIERITENIQALSQDTSTSFIDNIEREISTLKDKLSETSKGYTKYKDLISKLNSDGASLSVPTDRDSFFSVYDSIPFLEKKIDDKKESFEEKINENNITLRDIEIKIKEYEGELEYLSNRETNIPKEYDELRQNICSSL